MWFGLFIRSRGNKNRPGLSRETLSDEEIIGRYRREEDPLWIGILYDRYLHLVYGVCLKYLKNQENARDATMEIFERLMDDLKRHEIRSFHSWIYMVSKNHCLMKHRNRKHPEGLETLENNLLFMEKEDFLHLHTAEERELQYVKLEQAIERLNAEQQACIRLVYLENRSYQEVSVITGYSLKQVKSYVQNGKRNLRTLLESRT